MTKRRDFIKKSVIGTAGVTVGGVGIGSEVVNLAARCGKVLF